MRQKSSRTLIFNYTSFHVYIAHGKVSRSIKKNVFQAIQL